jgi:tetratricopeptide (TPR) repeat protein
MKYGDHFLTMGDFDKADHYYQKALPQLAKRLRIDVARSYILMRKFDESENLLLETKKRLSDDPDKLRYAVSHWTLSRLFMARLSYDEAVKFAKIGYEMEPSQPGALRFHRLSKALAFRAKEQLPQAEAEWQRLISEHQTIISAPSTDPANFYALGYIDSLKGDVELALEQLQIAFEKGYRVQMNYLYDPLLDNVRNDPRTKERFAELLKKVEATYPAIAQK